MVKLFEGPGKPPVPAAPPAEVPEGVKQVFNFIESAMPMIERASGLNRRDISLQLLKTGFKGGGIDTFLNGLGFGQKQQQEAKLVRYVKTLALWGPLAFFLMGLALVSLYFFVRMMIHLMGALPV